jgi:hypothetical protein
MLMTNRRPVVRNILSMVVQFFVGAAFIATVAIIAKYGL